MRRALVALASSAALACASIPDVELARDILGRATAAPAPMLREGQTAQLAAVRGLRTTPGELRSAPLRWEPLLTGDVAGYVVERALKRSGRFERIAAFAGRFHTAWVDRGNDLAEKVGAQRSVAGLGDGNSYFYRVRAFDSAGAISAQASEVTKATTAERPAAPGALQAFSQLPRSVALAWEASHDPTVAGYAILRSPTQTGKFLPIARVEGRYNTTFLDSGLGDLRVLYYRVASVNGAGGIGEPTEALLAVTKPEPLPPSKLRIVSREAGRTLLRWEANVEPDLVAYRILRRDTDANEETIGTVGPETLRFEDAAAPESPASYRVIAVDRDGLESLPSAPARPAE